MQENSLTSGKITSGLLKYSIPIILSMLATQLYSVADTMVIGLMLDSTALAAASNASTVLMIFLFISGGLELGANLLIGAKRPVLSEKELSDLTYNVIFVDFVASIVVTVAGFISFPAILRLINTPEEIMDAATTYGRIYTLGIPFLMYYDVSKEVIISEGSPKISLYFVVTTSVLNIILDLVLTVPLGVGGAALASSLSQVVGAVGITFVLRKKLLVGKFSFGIINKESIKDVIRLSFPNMLQQMTGPIVSNVRQSLLGGIGVAAIAGFSCANKVLSLMSMGMGGFAQGLVIFIAQNHSLGQQDRIKEGIKISYKLLTCSLAVMVAVTMLLRRPILRMFTSDAESIVYGELLLLYEPASWFIQMVTRIQEAKMRGRQRMAMYTFSSLSTTAVNLVATVLLVGVTGFSGFYIAAYVSAAYSAVESTLLANKLERELITA